MGLLLILVSDILGRIAVSLVRIIMMINDKSLRQIMLVMQMAMAMITINDYNGNELITMDHLFSIIDGGNYMRIDSAMLLLTALANN